LVNLGHFSQEKSFVEVEIIFFRLKFGENLPVRETLAESSSAFQECGPFNRPHKA
jgi:hypothetical protein